MSSITSMGSYSGEGESPTAATGIPLLASWYDNLVASEDMPLCGGVPPAFCNPVIPLGWKCRIYLITVDGSLQAAGTTTDFRLTVDGGSVGASFGLCQLTDAISVTKSEPTSPPYEIDATAAYKHLGCNAVLAGIGAGGRTLVQCFGYIYKP